MTIFFTQPLDYAYQGIMSMAAVLKQAGHKVHVLIDKNFPDEHPDIFGVSVLTGQQDWAKQVSRAAKERWPGTKVVWGGPHATHAPENCLENDCVDAVCIGEGEGAILDLANGATPETVQNIWTRGNHNALRPLISDLGSLPLPDRAIYSNFPTIDSCKTLVCSAARGCPYACTFCYNHNYHKLYRGKGKPVRRRPVEHLLKEIEPFESRIDNIYFNDDCFCNDIEWMERFVRSYKRRKPYTCMIRADQATAPMVKLLSESGCVAVYFGIESGSERIRQKILNKRISDAQIYAAADLLHENNIRFRTYNMLGFPTESMSEAWQTVEINLKIKTDYPWCSIFVPYPGTRLADECKRLDLIPQEYSADDVEPSFHDSSSLDMPHKNEIANLHKFFQTAVLWPWTIPIIRKLIKFPPNGLFRLWWVCVYGLVYIKSEGRKPIETIVWGIRNIGQLLSTKKQKTS